MNFDIIEDVVHRRISGIEFYRKYDRFLKQEIMLDTAPLFVLLVGRLKIKPTNQLLKEFKYSTATYNDLTKFLKLCRINTNQIIITPQILQELICHFQKAYSSLSKEGNVLKTFIKEYLDFLKLACKDISCWEILKDKKMFFLEPADISFLIYASQKKYTTLVTNDGDFYEYATKDCPNILAIDFNKILSNANFIPESIV